VSLKFLKDDITRLKLESNRSFSFTALSFIYLLSPRILPVFLFRLSHYCHKKVPIVSKFFSLINFVLFGIEINPSCKIGPGLIIAHTSGSVIGARSIGARCIIFQNVTLGAKYLDINTTNNSRPSIGDDVILGAGAKVLGGVSIGNGCLVGTNVVVLRDMADAERLIPDER
jgi:serine O-acetyltransferase|tara:strand:+ start:2105 stop:2617 length:513 start_codon:yes stop_codon:yes gene_type:complete